jgi:hypothetical protein
LAAGAEAEGGAEQVLGGVIEMDFELSGVGFAAEIWLGPPC